MKSYLYMTGKEYSAYCTKLTRLQKTLDKLTDDFTKLSEKYDELKDIENVRRSKNLSKSAKYNLEYHIRKDLAGDSEEALIQSVVDGLQFAKSSLDDYFAKLSRYNDVVNMSPEEKKKRDDEIKKHLEELEERDKQLIEEAERERKAKIKARKAERKAKAESEKVEAELNIILEPESGKTKEENKEPEKEPEVSSEEVELAIYLEPSEPAPEFDYFCLPDPKSAPEQSKKLSKRQKKKLRQKELQEAKIMPKNTVEPPELADLQKPVITEINEQDVDDEFFSLDDVICFGEESEQEKTERGKIKS